jgi:hypothetical protein
LESFDLGAFWHGKSAVSYRKQMEPMSGVEPPTY